MNEMRVQPRSAIYEMNSLYTCESSVNAKPPYNEHFLEDPVGVYYREVLLYWNKNFSHIYFYQSAVAS